MIADITANSVEAGATCIALECIQTKDAFNVTVADNGKGMSSQTLMRAKDPFYTDGKKHPGRKVGLGIPFLIQTAEETDGFWDIQSVPGKGTKVIMGFNLANIDTPPVGNLQDLFLDILTLPGNYDMDIHRKDDEAKLDYKLNRNELKDALGGELESAGSQILLRKFIESQEV
ncbi:MAG: ATP-binding protein [Treponema sp.]|nr:ATP-binding protein [Treponema sp.]